MKNLYRALIFAWTFLSLPPFLRHLRGRYSHRPGVIWKIDGLLLGLNLLFFLGLLFFFALQSDASTHRESFPACGAHLFRWGIIFGLLMARGFSDLKKNLRCLWPKPGEASHVDLDHDFFSERPFDFLFKGEKVGGPNYNFRILPCKEDWGPKPGESKSAYLTRLQRACYRKATQIRNLSEFLAYVSHELRTPLNSIIGFAQHLLREPEEPNREEWLKIIEGAGKNLLLISTELLDFSKIQAGTLKIHRTRFCLRKLFEETIQLLAATAHAQGLQLNLFLPRDLPAMVKGDPIRLQQILANLISNAIKYTPRGEVNCRVQWEEDTPKLAGILVNIEDTGPGIAPEAQSQLFKNFMRLGDPQEAQELVPGSGLGLAICWKLASAMQGQLGITSKDGGGSKFWFRAPLQPLTPPQSAQQFLTEGDREELLLLDPPGSWEEMVANKLASEPLTCSSLSHEAFLASSPRPSPWPRLLFLDPAAPPSHEALAQKIECYCAHEPNFRWLLLVPFGLVDYGIRGLARLQGEGLVHLPCTHEGLVKALQGAAVSPLSRSHPPLGSKGLKKGSGIQEIWVVDDQPYNLKLVEAFSRPLGLIFRGFLRSEAAVQALKQGTPPPDLILLDIEMPEMGGIEARRAIEGLGLKPKAPRLFALTAGVSGQQIAALKTEGFQEILHKPLFFEKFKALIAAVGQGRDQRRGGFSEKTDWGQVLDRLQGEQELLAEYVAAGLESVEQLLKALEAPWVEGVEAHRRTLHHLSAITATLGWRKGTASLHRWLERWRKTSLHAEPATWPPEIQRGLKNLLSPMKLAFTSAYAEQPWKKGQGCLKRP